MRKYESCPGLDRIECATPVAALPSRGVSGRAVAFPAGNLLAGACVALLLSVCGCATETSVQHGQFSSPGDNGDSQVDPSKLTPTQLAVINPSAAQLQNIEGLLLEHYLISRTLPDQLADLASLADIDEPLNLVCPTSGQPYVYVRSGVPLPGQDKRIVVFEPTPSKDGKRWCILMSTPAPRQAMWMDVLEVPESAFKAYEASIGQG
jgi:hypothetical protein